MNQSLVSRIIEDNGYEVFMTKDPSNSNNFQISKLDLKKIPMWLRERFDSILSNSDTGDFESLADELSRNISKISLAEVTHSNIQMSIQCLLLTQPILKSE